MLTSHQRRARQRDDLRQAILTAAGELILERGYDGLSMRQVGDRIGYSATTIYHHFENRDALVAAVIDEGFGRFLRALQSVTATDPLERIADLGRAYVQFGLEHRTYYQLMFMERPDLLNFGSGERQSDRSATFQLLLDAVQEGIDAGEIRPGDARAFSNVLWAGVHGVVALALKLPGFDEAIVQQMTELTIDIHARGIRR
jgi:AcrR family transcriptional regulator